MKKTKQQLGKMAKNKGSTFERRVAKDISKYTRLRWRRTPLSGAGHISGDIFCLDFEFPYVLECKNRKDVNLQRIFKNPTCIQPYLEENQILIFNSGGQVLCVIEHPMFVQTPQNHQDIRTYFNIGDNYYIILELEQLCYLITQLYTPQTHEDGSG